MYKDSNVPANRLSKLLDKIERRLGTVLLNLPETIGKDYWVRIIEDDSLPVFSRFFPYKVITIIDHTCEKDGFYFIDKDLPEGSIILGVKDVDWNAYRCNNGYDRYNFLSTYGADEVALTQVSADYMSFFNLGIYIEFLPPNKIKLVSVNGSSVTRFRSFPLGVFIQHPSNLMTISPTMMNIFEDLCTADVATFLYEQLKHFDDTETSFLTLSLKLETIQDWKNKRDDIISRLDEAHTTTANEDQILIMTV
jgi:hypothetical protein